MRGWFFLIAAFISWSCSPTSVVTTNKKEDRKDIDSLFIVKSLPINLMKMANENSSLRSIRDSLFSILRGRNYRCVDEKEAKQMYLDNQDLLFGANNRQRMDEVIENIKKDKKYIEKEVAIAEPYLQIISLSPYVNNINDNWILVKRVNYPNVMKQRTWAFNYKSSETASQIANQILDSLINQKYIK